MNYYGNQRNMNIILKQTNNYVIVSVFIHYLNWRLQGVFDINDSWIIIVDWYQYEYTTGVPRSHYPSNVYSLVCILRGYQFMFFTHYRITSYSVGYNSSRRQKITDTTTHRPKTCLQKANLSKSNLTNLNTTKYNQ